MSSAPPSPRRTPSSTKRDPVPAMSPTCPTRTPSMRVMASVATMPAASAGDPALTSVTSMPRADTAPTVTPKKARTRRPSRSRSASTSALAGGRASSSMPCAVPASGGAPRTVDANATSTSPRNVACAADRPRPQSLASRPAVNASSTRSGAVTMPSASTSRRREARPGWKTSPRSVTCAGRPCGKPEPRTSSLSPTSTSWGEMSVTSMRAGVRSRTQPVSQVARRMRST